jgi:hypothetical protein
MGKPNGALITGITRARRINRNSHARLQTFNAWTYLADISAEFMTQNHRRAQYRICDPPMLKVVQI